MIVDLRSDTVTRPTPKMLEAMIHAEVGDDVFGDDPTVLKLQERVAAILGKEDALFVPTGTMANQIAINVSTQPGDEVYCDEGCHILNYESGAPALLSGVQLMPVAGERGVFRVDQVAEKVRPENNHFAPPRLIEVENTHNRSGGTVWPVERVKELRDFCNSNKLKLHLDGARLWNAAVAKQCDVQAWSQYADTVSVCFSKGLGCPVGSAIAGDSATIQKAKRARKRFGGGMRQSGYLAACALYALDNHRERMVDDHRRAKQLAIVLNDCGYEIDPALVETNILIFSVREGRTGTELVEFAKSQNVLLTAFGVRKLRAVTHLDIDDKKIDAAIQTFRDFARQ
ncbi:MAG: low-specificity L-threonine aldolase [bacterium]|nr:low-specificity L-threonine aldolase [bacterium]